jgi:hypothetical protein
MRTVRISIYARIEILSTAKNDKDAGVAAINIMPYFSVALSGAV